jgi:hypothetical protein
MRSVCLTVAFVGLLVPESIAQSAGYAVSQQKRKLIAGFRLGQEHRRYAPGDGARLEEGQSDVCIDDGRVQPRAHAHLGRTPRPSQPQ